MVSERHTPSPFLASVLAGPSALTAVYWYVRAALLGSSIMLVESRTPLHRRHAYYSDIWCGCVCPMCSTLPRLLRLSPDVCSSPCSRQAVRSGLAGWRARFARSWVPRTGRAPPRQSCDELSATTVQCGLQRWHRRPRGHSRISMRCQAMQLAGCAPSRVRTSALVEAM